MVPYMCSDPYYNEWFIALGEKIVFEYHINHKKWHEYYEKEMSTEEAIIQWMIEYVGKNKTLDR